MHPVKVLYEESTAVIETNAVQTCLSSNKSLGSSKFFASTVTSRTYPPILTSSVKELETPSTGTALTTEPAPVTAICEDNTETKTSIEENTESELSSADDSDSDSSENGTESCNSSDYQQEEEHVRIAKQEAGINEKSLRPVDGYEKKLKHQVKPENTALNQFIQLLKAEEYSTSETKGSYVSELRSKLSSTSAEVRSSGQSVSSQRSEYSMFELIDIDSCWAAWDYKNQPNKVSLIENINRSLNEHPRLYLIRVYIGKIQFNCHRLVLRYAKFFHSLDRKTYEFTAEDRLTAIAFMYFYQFAMGLKPIIQAESFLDVLKMTELFKVPALQLYCMQLLDSELYHEHRAFEIFKAAKRQHNLTVQRLMMARVWKFFMPFVATRNFIDLEVNDVCGFLESDTIGVNSEIEVFYAAILWLSAKSKKRRGKILERVMGCVRYGLLPPWFTYSLKRGTGIPEVDRILEFKCVNKMIEDGASIAATIGLYFVEPSKFEAILHRLLPKVPNQRNWVFDRNCTYHYGAHEKVSEAVDFIVFKDYLKILELESQNYWHNFQEADDSHLLQVFSQQFSDLAWSKMQL